MSKQLLVNYTMAHSSPKGSWGARSDGGVFERTVCENALPAFRARCEQAGHEVVTHEGPLGVKIRMIEKAIRAVRKDGRPYVSVSLHFNQSPTVLCPNPRCVLPEQENGKPVHPRVHRGVPCPHCGGATPGWEFGHTVFAARKSLASMELAAGVMNALGLIMPWSVHKPIIGVPWPNKKRNQWPNNVAWPRSVYRPAVLVEAGFGCDPQFSTWIQDKRNQHRYGLAVADAVCDFYDDRKLLPLDDWHL